MLRTEYSGPSTQPKAQYSICFVLSIQYWILMTQCSAFCNQYSVLVISHQYSALSAQLSVLSIQYSILNTQHSMLSAARHSVINSQVHSTQHSLHLIIEALCSILNVQDPVLNTQYSGPSTQVNTQYSLRGQYPVLMTHCSTSVASTHCSRTSTQC